MQFFQNLRIRLFEEPCRKLVQKAPNVFRSIQERPCIFRLTRGLQLDMLLGMLQQAGSFGQRRKSYRGRTSGQGVRQRDRHVR